MDFGFAPHELEFLGWVRETLRGAEIVAELELLAEDARAEPDERRLYRLLGAAGLLAVGWPTEHGGLGRDAVSTAIVTEELGRAGVPDTLFVNSIQTVGQIVLAAGTPAARARLLPALAAGEKFASVLYTEPEAGSDLASLRCRATRVDGGFTVSGTKVFNLKSAITDVALCAARTEDTGTRYGGLTLLLVDLHAPEVRIDRVPTLADEQFCVVELGDVEVSDDDVVGGVGDGWATLVRALPLERTGFDFTTRAERWLSLGRGGEPDAERAGRYRTRTTAARLLAWRAALNVSADAIDPLPATTAKWYSSELAAELAGWAMGRNRDGVRPRAADAAERAYREAPGLRLAGGTSEMMLHTLAEHLPDIVGEPS